MIISESVKIILKLKLYVYAYIKDIVKFNICILYIICILNIYHIYYDHMTDVAFSSTILMLWEERPFGEQGMPAGVESLGRSNKSGGGRLGGIRMKFIRDRRWGSRKGCQGCSTAELEKKNWGLDLGEE